MSLVLPNPVFEGNISIHDGSHTPEQSDVTLAMFPYRAALREIGGVKADTFMEFAGRFAVRSSEIFGSTDIELKVDAAHSNLTIECPELYEELAAQPGERIVTPADPRLFTQIFSSLRTVDLKISPQQKRDGNYGYASVSWERVTPEIIEFYAQGSDEINKFMQERMFHVTGSAPRKRLEVAVGANKSWLLKEKSIGEKEHRARGLAALARMTEIIYRTRGE